MKKIIILIILFVSILLGCVTQSQSSVLFEEEGNFSINRGENFINLNISTDKEVYYSNELMNIKIEIMTEKEIKDVYMMTYGIVDNFGRYRLNDTRLLNISAGKNLITFEYRTPSCYGCAGISPGNYTLVAVMMNGNDTIANATCEIEIRG
ncbi:MAG: hypothetical protein OH319_04640 [Candidatus Parvarchaeota archaeon]|nr:hypothetical protein [Candidatus Jingweiarchaeum tengchongense]MCW1298656.1 hypothetical protein [Candidatus Jingweiarchaeum tengchongense]MCW1300498.1 hypothetical protein [Candidatus Jingweiarchaeum tengchongense]MCW1304687.1 hypothetical protein [Candidatus Jingweiarchaeum tengchongense]MCW1305876.1 hypothetical protein [Candidatus Jingweiarchaeum tengchongense]